MLKTQEGGRINLENVNQSLTFENKMLKNQIIQTAKQLEKDFRSEKSPESKTIRQEKYTNRGV